MAIHRRVSVRAIVFHDDKLLCVRHKKYQGSVINIADNWCLPGGGLEEGEALLDGIRREMVEETGISPQIGRLLYVQQFAHDGTEFLEFFFHVTNASDYLQVNLAATTHGLEEIAEIAFVDPATANILPVFLTTESLGEHAASSDGTRFFSLL